MFDIQYATDLASKSYRQGSNDMKKLVVEGLRRAAKDYLSTEGFNEARKLTEEVGIPEGFTDLDAALKLTLEASAQSLMIAATFIESIKELE